MGTPRHAGALSQLPPGLGFRLLFAFLALHFLWSTLGPRGRSTSSLDVDFETREEDADFGQHSPFGLPAATGGGKRALHPQELCAWDTALNVSGPRLCVCWNWWPAAVCAAAASGTPLALPASASLHSLRCACLGL